MLIEGLEEYEYLEKELQEANRKIMSLNKTLIKILEKGVEKNDRQIQWATMLSTISAVLAIIDEPEVKFLILAKVLEQEISSTIEKKAEKTKRKLRK
jgi:hypothetical protein